jgi:hypothetical protein
MRPRLPLMILGISLLAAPGCASCGQEVLCAVRGPINASSNYSLRRAIMAHGLSEFCHQMLAHNAPLSLIPGAPTVGRFFPKTCTQATLPNGDLFIQFDGLGYAFTPLTKKLTFSVSGAVEYDQDFRVGDGCDIFAYFRTKNVKSSNFNVHLVEQPIASFLNSLSGLSNDVGRQLVTGRLGDGFTVVQDRNQNIDFSLGLLPAGQKPSHPVDGVKEGGAQYESSRTEIHQDQRDFVGPIEIAADKRALYVDATLDGLMAVDVLVMRKEDAEVALGLYYNYPRTGPLNAPVLYGEVISTGQPYKQAFNVPKGSYYVVFDNTPTAGRVAPPPAMSLLEDHMATLSYAVAVGDAK